MCQGFDGLDGIAAMAVKMADLKIMSKSEGTVNHAANSKTWEISDIFSMSSIVTHEPWCKCS